jgi:hypothetical protein
MKTKSVTQLSVDSVRFDDLGRAIIDDERLLEAIAGGAGSGGMATPDTNVCCDGGSCNAYKCG